MLKATRNIIIIHYFIVAIVPRSCLAPLGLQLLHRKGRKELTARI